MTISSTKQTCLIWVFVMFSSISKSLATSIDEIDINDFVQMEEVVISKLQNCLTQEQQRLSQLRKHQIGWKTWRDSNTDQEKEYITIPQNLFHLFKISTLDLNELEAIVKGSFINAKVLDKFEPPSEDHLKTTILSLIDLQYQYDLKPEDIIHEIFRGFQPDTSSLVDLCYFVGKTCFDQNNHLCAVDWLRTCFMSISDIQSRKKIVKLLFTSYIFLNETETAFGYAKYSLKYDAFDTATMHTVLDLGSRLHHVCIIHLDDSLTDILKADQICRAEHNRPSKPNLKCRYNHENSAFLKIAPLKEEELYDAPRILFYRDVVYDSEIEFVKNETTKYMELAQLAGQETPSFAYRVTETTFLDNDLPPLAALEKRTEDIANLQIEYSESWQVLNYCPGGFYSIHSDCLPVRTNNRMTTMLFYFNDVTLGGETVFPRIGVSATPTKGAVLVWHNVHAHGLKNMWTDHSACPVIIGEKWGFTRWVRALKNPQCLRSIYEADLKIFENIQNVQV